MANNCPYFLGGKCNNPSAPMVHDCSWPGNDYQRCSVYRLITNPEAAKRELLEAFAGRTAPAPPPASASPAKEAPCYCCGRMKTAASCPACGCTDWEVVYGGLVLFVVCVLPTLFWFRSTFWVITGWVLAGLCLLISVVTVIVNLVALRRGEVRGTVTNEYGDAIYGDDAAYNKDRYYGRVGKGASLVLLDRKVHQNQFGIDIIKVKVVVDSFDVRNIGRVCWIDLGKTSFVHRLRQKRR